MPLLFFCLTTCYLLLFLRCRQTGDVALYTFFGLGIIALMQIGAVVTAGQSELEEAKKAEEEAGMA